MQRELSVRYADTYFDFAFCDSLWCCISALVALNLHSLSLVCLSEFPWLGLNNSLPPLSQTCFWSEPALLGLRALLASAQQTQPLPQTLSVLESTPQVRGLHTIIRYRPLLVFSFVSLQQQCIKALKHFILFCHRSKETSRDEFIFYSKRLMRLLIEHALTFLPSQVLQLRRRGFNQCFYTNNWSHDCLGEKVCSLWRPTDNYHLNLLVL